MSSLQHLLDRNAQWAQEMAERDPACFSRLAHQQSPHYLWVGCSDSRVPANQITGLSPGDVFVHRNVANLVIHTDLNMLSVLQYAVEVLEIRDIIVCGHYGCGGVRSALEAKPLGLIENWLRHIQDLARHHRRELAVLPSDDARVERLCELNVIEQVLNVAETTVLEAAWDRGQAVSVHGWIYDVSDGRLRDLNVQLSCAEDLRRRLDADW